MNWIQAYSAAMAALGNCERTTNHYWVDRWIERLKQLEDYLPHGSGIDDGIKITSCTDRALKGHFDFHCMNDGGYYDGYAAYSFTATAVFDGIDLNLRGQDKDGLKDYLGDLLHKVFTAPAPAYPWEEEAA